jgi:hypothetical protein
MIYDVNKLTSTYQLNLSAGNSGAFGTYPESGTSYVERRQLEGTPIAPVSLCAFGSVYQDDEGDWYLLGGVIYCGDKNFYVEDKWIENIGVEGYSLVWIELKDIKPNVDEDESVILPGIKTCTGTPKWDRKVYNDGVSYDNNTNITGPTSTGTVIVPVGRLFVKDNVATLESHGCGNVFINQCVGTLSFTRV